MADDDIVHEFLLHALGQSSDPSKPIQATDVTDIEAAWQKCVAYATAHGLPPSADTEDPASEWWRQAEALHERDPAFADLFGGLLIAVTRSTPQGRELLARANRAKLKAE